MRGELAEQIANMMESRDEKIAILEEAMAEVQEEMRELRERTIEKPEAVRQERMVSEIFGRYAKLHVERIPAALKDMGYELDADELENLKDSAESQGVCEINMDEFCAIVDQKRERTAEHREEEQDQGGETPKSKRKENSNDMTPEKDHGKQNVNELGMELEQHCLGKVKKVEQESHESEPRKNEEANEEEDDEDMPAWARALVRKLGEIEEAVAQKENTEKSVVNK